MTLAKNILFFCVFVLSSVVFASDSLSKNAYLISRIESLMTQISSLDQDAKEEKIKEILKVLLSLEAEGIHASEVIAVLAGENIFPTITKDLSLLLRVELVMRVGQPFIIGQSVQNSRIQHGIFTASLVEILLQSSSEMKIEEISLSTELDKPSQIKVLTSSHELLDAGFETIGPGPFELTIQSATMIPLGFRSFSHALQSDLTPLSEDGLFAMSP